MPQEPYYDPIYSEHTNDANLAHDKKYGWSGDSPRVYTNLARNPEYEHSVPPHLINAAKDAEEEHKILWDWHNRDKGNPTLRVLPPA